MLDGTAQCFGAKTMVIMRPLHLRGLFDIGQILHIEHETFKFPLAELGMLMLSSAEIACSLWLYCPSSRKRRTCRLLTR